MAGPKRASTGGGAPVGETAPPAGLRDAVRGHIQAYLDGDLDRVLSHLGGLWQDLASGETHSRSGLRPSLEAGLADPLWRAIRADGRRAEEVFDLPGMVVQVLDAHLDKERAALAHFRPHTGDCWVTVEPVPGGPLPEPWVGVYRAEGGRWLMVAGD